MNIVVIVYTIHCTVYSVYIEIAIILTMIRDKIEDDKTTRRYKLQP